MALEVFTIVYNTENKGANWAGTMTPREALPLIADIIAAEAVTQALKSAIPKEVKEDKDDG
jgi:hypothetical protein